MHPCSKPLSLCLLGGTCSGRGGNGPLEAFTRAFRLTLRGHLGPVSRGGLNQESQHNKHNNPGQSGHKPQK